MVPVTELHTRQDVDRLLEASHERPVVLLKHSVSCPVSARGREQFLRLDADGDPPLYLVVVQHARDASTYVAEVTGIRHESPQALVLSRGAVPYHASHHHISTDALRRAAREAAAPRDPTP